MKFDVSALSPEELVVLIADAKWALYPEAVIVGNELECSACHERGTPTLIEDGITVTHELESPSTAVISARGWTATPRMYRKMANGCCSNVRIASSDIAFPMPSRLIGGEVSGRVNRPVTSKSQSSRPQSPGMRHRQATLVANLTIEKPQALYAHTRCDEIIVSSRGDGVCLQAHKYVSLDNVPYHL